LKKEHSPLFQGEDLIGYRGKNNDNIPLNKRMRNRDEKGKEKKKEVEGAERNEEHLRSENADAERPL